MGSSITPPFMVGVESHSQILGFSPEGFMAKAGPGCIVGAPAMNGGVIASHPTCGTSSIQLYNENAN